MPSACTTTSSSYWWWLAYGAELPLSLWPMLRDLRSSVSTALERPIAIGLRRWLKGAVYGWDYRIPEGIPPRWTARLTGHHRRRAVVGLVVFVDGRLHRGHGRRCGRSPSRHVRSAPLRQTDWIGRRGPVQSTGRMADAVADQNRAATPAGSASAGNRDSGSRRPVKPSASMPGTGLSASSVRVMRSGHQMLTYR